MKYLKSTLAAAALLTSANASALEGQYFGAQLGLSDYAFYNTGIAIIATYGLPVTSLLPDLQLPDNVKNNLSLEAEFTTNLLSPASVGSFDATIHSFGGYGVFAFPVSPELSVRARAGLVFALLSYDYVDYDPFTFTPTTGSRSETNINLSFSGGITYKLSDNMSFIAEYTSLGSSVNNLSGGVQLRF